MNLFGSDKYDKILEKRPTPPGQAGGKMSKKSEYGRQLREKQKVKMMYGVTEKQLRNIFEEAQKADGMTSVMMMSLLERRMDNVVFRCGYARSRMQARQMVSHGHFMLNGRRVDVPSIRLKEGDKIQVRDRVKGSPLFLGYKEMRKDVGPEWVMTTKSNMSIEVKGEPNEDDIDQLIDPSLIVEFYSR